MKIGVNALFMIPGEVGGSETYLRKTLQAAAKGHPQHEFVVFTNAENRQVLARDLMSLQNVVLVDMRVKATSRLRRILREQFTLPRVIAANGIEVLWNPGNTAPTFVKCPQATTVYDMQYEHFPQDFSRLGLFFTKRFTRSSLRRSQVVLTISEFSRQEIVKFTNTQFEKIKPIPLSADADFAVTHPGDFVAERVMVLTRSADPYILMVSNTYPHKSMETGVQAFGKIMSEIPHKLVLIGKSRRGEPEVEKAIAELPEEGRVVRLQYVMGQDLAALYQGADLFVFPSKYEGFGLPVLEAMTAGVPVITTREGSIPEVGGDTVDYAAAGDFEAFAAAMKKLLALDPAAREAWVSRARARAARFSWAETARATIAVLESMRANV